MASVTIEERWEFQRVVVLQLGASLAGKLPLLGGQRLVVLCRLDLPVRLVEGIPKSLVENGAKPVTLVVPTEADDQPT